MFGMRKLGGAALLAVMAVGCGGSGVSTTALTGSVTFSSATTSPAYGGSTAAFTSPATNSSSGNVYLADDITRKVTITFPAGTLYQGMVLPVSPTNAALDYFDPNAFTYSATSGRITLSSSNGYTLNTVRVDDGTGRAVTLNGGFAGFTTPFSAVGGVNGTFNYPTTKNYTVASGTWPTFTFTEDAIATADIVTITLAGSAPGTGNVLKTTATISHKDDATATATIPTASYVSVYQSGTSSYTITLLGSPGTSGVFFR